MNSTKKELDDFINTALKYAKEHNLGYVIAVGKKLGDQCAVMDSWWESDAGYLESMTSCFLKGEGSIPTAIKWGIIEEAREFNKKTSH